MIPIFISCAPSKTWGLQAKDLSRCFEISPLEMPFFGLHRQELVGVNVECVVLGFTRFSKIPISAMRMIFLPPCLASFVMVARMDVLLAAAIAANDTASSSLGAKAR